MDDQSETAQFKEQCLKHLDGVLRKIRGFGDGVYALDDEHLATLNIRKAEPLDIEERTVDFGPRFFYPRFTLDQARQKTTDYFADHEEERQDCVWPKRCRRGSFDEEDFWHPLCDAMSEAGRRLKWFFGALGEDAPDPWRPSPNLGVWEGSEWHFWPGERLIGNLPGHFGHQARTGGIQQEYLFYVNYACLITDDAAELPHIGGTVIDSAESKDEEVLWSEVVAAISFLKLQFRCGHFCHHHTLPAIVFSFQHDRFGRVTQFHFDGRSLVLRQSRLLNFRSDEPTTDAYHMIRWMANRPMGETRFRETAEDHPPEPGLRDIDKNSGPVPVEPLDHHDPLCSGIARVRGREGLQWLPKRQSFSLGSANNAVCEARTDGLLRSVGNLGPSGTLAILEAKPYTREEAQAKIEWQEACQMAAWISTTIRETTAEKRRAGALSSPGDDSKKRRILISQDHRFLYLTVGEWGKGYEDHLNGGPRPATPPSKSNSASQNRGRAEAASVPESPSQTTEIVPDSGAGAAAVARDATPEDLDEGNFLVMHCYGPYSVGNPGHLRSFMRNVLALMLELSDPWE